MTNKMKILIVVCVVFLAGAGVFTSWMVMHNQSSAVEPPLTSLILISPDGTGAAGIVMRTYDNPLTGADMQKLRDAVNGKLEVQPAPTTVETLPATDAKNRIVIYGYSVGRDGKPDEYVSNVRSSQNISDVYSKGVDWFLNQTKWDMTTTVYTEKQVIDIASGYVPSFVLNEAKHYILIGYGEWISASVVTFYGFSLTREQLSASGWQEDAKTVFDDSFSHNDTYTQLEIVVNPYSGEVLHKTAATIIQMATPSIPVATN